MGLTVYWSRLAEEKLEDIFNYYKQKAGIQLHEKSLQELLNAQMAWNTILRLVQKKHY